MDEFNKFKEEVTSMVKNKLALIWVILDYIKNLTKPILILWLIPLVGVYLVLLYLVVRIIAQLGST
jgi:hypothetical protein